MINELPDPVLTQVCRLKAVLGAPRDFSEGPGGRRWVVPMMGGVFNGPELNGNLLPGGSSSWQAVPPNGTARADFRYALQTDRGARIYVRSSSVGHLSDDDGYLLHATTRMETTAPELDWLNTGIFITVMGRTAVTQVHETYLVG